MDPLETVIDRFATVAAHDAVFVYVSSVYVEDTPAGFEEYANAKREEKPPLKCSADHMGSGIGDGDRRNC